jgi:hypothetical protein
LSTPSPTPFRRSATCAGSHGALPGP